MVHALHEAHRVLKSNGVLIDLRPALEHRRVGIVADGAWHAIGLMREDFADDRAANRAVRRVLAQGLFFEVSRRTLDLDRIAGTPEDFRGWLEDSVWRGTLSRHDWLIQRVERAWAKAPEGARIVVRGPLTLGVLTKREG